MENYGIAGIIATAEEAHAFMQKYLSVIPPSIYRPLEILFLGGGPPVVIKEKDLDQMQQELADKTFQMDLLSKTTSLNNKGSELERNGNIGAAIESYEECIKLQYPARFSYERLMVLYRKAKQYDDEMRVIDIAIQLFSIENCRRYKIAVANTKNEKYLSCLEAAYKANVKLKNDEGWYIYNPYDVGLWKKRRIKAAMLKSNTEAQKQKETL